MNLSMMNSARRRAVLRDYRLDHPLSEEELVERLIDTELCLRQEPPHQWPSPSPFL